MIHKYKQLRPIIACGLAFVLWGLDTPLIKTSLKSFPLFSLLFIKFLVGGVVFMVLARRSWKPMSVKIWFRIISATLIGYAITMVLIYKGIQLTGGLNTSLIYLLAPLIVYFSSIRFLKERYDSKLLLSVVAGFLGAILIVGAPFITGNSGAEGSTLGNIFILLAVLADVAGTIIIKPTLTKVATIQMTAVRFVIAAVLLLPFAARELPQLVQVNISPATGFALAYNFIFATLIAFYLYHWGLNKISGEQVSPLHYLDPMVGAVASMLILGERPTTTILAGIILIICGLYFGGAHKLKIGHHIGHHR